MGFQRVSACVACTACSATTYTGSQHCAGWHTATAASPLRCKVSVARNPNKMERSRKNSIKNRTCDVKSCRKRAQRGFSDLPQDTERRLIWIRQLQIQKVKKKYSICHDHFSDECFEHSRSDGRLKQKGIIPTLKLPPTVSQFQIYCIVYVLTN